MGDRRLISRVGETKYRIMKWCCERRPVFFLIVKKYLDRKEKGELFSGTLRRLFRELFDIDAGFGSYGWFNNGFRPHTKIGAYCSIAKDVKRFSHDREMDMFSTHSIFQRSSYGFFKENICEKELVIGNDVWIGANVVITAGCGRIGDGAVIGAGAVVAGDIEPYAIAVGNPARVIRYRFSEEDRRKLMDSKWYELTPAQLAELEDHSENIDLFTQKVYEIRERDEKN